MDLAPWVRRWRLFREWATSSGMSKADRRRWEAARTREDLAELTAQWLEGRIGSQPAYMANHGPDPETGRLVSVLAALNRAGFLTCSSQPGETGDGPEGSPAWEQRAAVEGFADAGTARWIQIAAEAAGLIVIAHDPADLPRWIRYDKAVPVTRVNGRAYTRFGAALSRRHLANWWTGYGICHPDAVAAVAGSWQVTVADPEWGRADLLWQVLGQLFDVPAR